MSRAWIFACLLIGIIASATASARAGVLIVIDKSTQTMTVSVDGVKRWHWPVSTGRRGYDTPSGSFTTFRMEAKHFSREWDDAPMPHSIFFTKKGHAIHGYLNTRNIGRPASHGCVRLEPANAAKLFAVVKKEGLPNTKVVLSGDIRVALRNTTKRRTADTPPARHQATGYQRRAAQYQRRQPYGQAPSYERRYYERGYEERRYYDGPRYPPYPGYPAYPRPPYARY